MDKESSVIHATTASSLLAPAMCLEVLAASVEKNALMIQPMSAILSVERIALAYVPSARTFALTMYCSVPKTSSSPEILAAPAVNPSVPVLLSDVEELLDLNVKRAINVLMI